MAESYGAWEPVIGLEIHAQLLTRTKLFCSCETSFGDPPNTHCCPVCLGLPGALPVLNEAAVTMALLAALSLGCGINERSVFARKHYFYPDLPKGYQISQYQEPLAEGGRLVLAGEGTSREVGITRLHIEEDAGKNLHAADAGSIVDLNRAGIPLIEIVGEPDLRSPAEARATMKRLREQLMFAGVNDGNLEQGSLRCDANVSVRRRGDAALGTRVELKNINSFRFVEDALDGEIRRQIERLESGSPIMVQTRGYNADRRASYPLRDKAGDEGYRYFPEPDLPPLVIDHAALEAARARLPEPPASKRARFAREHRLSEQAASVLTNHPRTAAFFEEAAMLSRQPIKVANFIQNEVLRNASFDGLSASFPVSARHVAELVQMVDAGSISGKQAKQVYARMRETHTAPAAVVGALGLKVISDEGTLRKMAADLVTAHPVEAARYREGKSGLLGFFVGQLMKATRGSADPKRASELLAAALTPAETTTAAEAGEPKEDDQ